MQDYFQKLRTWTMNCLNFHLRKVASFRVPLGRSNLVECATIYFQTIAAQINCFDRKIRIAHPRRVALTFEHYDDQCDTQLDETHRDG